eukprot:INCI2562.2.p1 GENE.INCI2562.2~~INCI2562.2.p1  ORF type:complete len:1331 (-),score=232.62 INCI2562.2:11-3901(-)
MSGAAATSASNALTATQEEFLFEDIASTDFLSFQFESSKYSDSIQRAVQRTGKLCGVSCAIRTLTRPGTGEGIKVVWLKHDFRFLGGSLGCAEGEKLVLGFEYARSHGLPVVVECKSGGARMQEGTLSLMQLAKVSVAVAALRKAGLPYIALLVDPTYGGVSASYAMQADVRIGIEGARIGFAGPSVILDTMYKMDRAEFDKECPPDFQSAEYLLEHGQLDMVLTPGEETAISTISKILSALVSRENEASGTADATVDPSQWGPSSSSSLAAPQYLRSRSLTRPQPQDFIAALFSDFVELQGDGKVGSDNCIRGGVATLVADAANGRPIGTRCVVIANFKGHDAKELESANYGMATPHGYRKALRLMELAERFQLPVFTLVDTCGAYPSFDAERDGQSEAIATNLTRMAELTVPIITLVVGEGGSGGALGLAMGNSIAMLSSAYYSVISPEGAASILGRYTDADHKARQFPLDCQQLAKVQQIYASQLKALGVIDEVIAEEDGETHEGFPVLLQRVLSFYAAALKSSSTPAPELVKQRYAKFRAMGRFEKLTPEQMTERFEAAANAPKSSSKGRRRGGAAAPKKGLLQYIANETLKGKYSFYKGRAPPAATEYVKEPADVSGLLDSRRGPAVVPRELENAKSVLDARGPSALAEWVVAQKRVLLTDTTFRDAHQSLVATRFRSVDLLGGADLQSQLFGDLFSMECWGGATFDVCMRFLHEDPWERLRLLRARIPNICLQMLIRGSNLVGYRNYPDNVVKAFISSAAKNGIDIFRIFDCFNDLEQMRVSIEAVRAAGKVAEVCICYTGDASSPSEKIYTVEYYCELATRIAAAGAHFICIKDMAGLMKPQAASIVIPAIRKAVPGIPVHYHTHATSSLMLATCLAASDAGCDIIDFAVESMADQTSQPSLNAFCAAMTGAERDPGIDYLALQPLVRYWAKIREMYRPFESGMLSGTARVFEHQIPGGQYSNLMVQCKSMGLWSQWDRVLDTYRDVNRMFGDIIKVTPSSKVVGDMALYMINAHLTVEDVKARAETVAWPDSVIALCRGMLGAPHRGLPDDIVNMVLKSAGQERLTERPGSSLEPADFDAARKAVAELKASTGAAVALGADATEEHVLCHLIYEKVFSDYCEFLGENSAVTHLPSNMFWYGLVPGQEGKFSLPRDIAVANGFETLLPDDSDDEVVLTLTLDRIEGIKRRDQRTLHFIAKSANGTHSLQITLTDEVAGSAANMTMADPKDETQIAAPLAGQVEFIAEAGSRIAAGEPVAIIVAMKMEVTVKVRAANLNYCRQSPFWAPH